MSVWLATSRRLEKSGPAALVVGTFLALTVIHLWPLARQIDTVSTPNSDTAINVWWVSQMARQMVSRPLHLFQGNTFYPHSDTMATVDHMLASAVVAIPLWVTTRNPTLVHNVMLLVTFVLSGVFTAFLVRRLCGSLLAGMVSGCAFAFCAFRWYELPHLHILSTAWIPLALLTLDRLIEVPSRGRTAAFAGAALAVGLSSWHTAIVGGSLIGVVACFLLAQRRGAVRTRLLAIGGVALMVGLVLAPVAVPYAHLASWRPPQTPDQRARSLNRSAVTVQEFLPRQLALGPPPEVMHGNARASWAFPGIVTWALAMGAFLPRRQTGLRPPISWPLRVAATIALGILGLLAAAIALGANGRPGMAAVMAPRAPLVVLVVCMAAFAILAARRQAFDEQDEHFVSRGRRARLIYAVVAATGLLIALGPRASAWGVELGSGIYRPDWFPLFAVLRSPERFGLLFAFGLAVLAGLGARRLASFLTARARAAAVLIMIVILNVDLRPAPINVQGEDLPGPGHYWLARSTEPGAVIEMPSRRWKLALRGAFVHERRTVNGVGFVYPPGYLRMWGRPDFSRERLNVLWEFFHPQLVLIRGRYYTDRQRAQLLSDAEAERDAVALISRVGPDLIFRLKDRGRGPVLSRRWPRAFLEDRTGVAFSATVTGGRAERSDRLLVRLNGHSVLELEGQQAHEDVQRRVPIRPEWLVAGENRFEILGDYRYGPAESPNTIGQTGASIAADLRVRAGRDGWYRVNGDQRNVPPGYLLVTLDPITGRVIDRASFDTTRRLEDSAALARFVETLPDATPVLVVSEDDASQNLTEEAVTALATLGLGEDLRGRRGWAHAAVGLKGAPRGTALERVHRSRAEVTIGKPESREVQLDGFDVY